MLDVRLDNIFLDSSIILSFHKGEEITKIIKKIINSADIKSTSSYCIVEYLNIIMETCKYILGKLEQYQSLEKFLYFIDNALNIQQRSKVMWSHNLLNSVYGKDDKSKTIKAIEYIKYISNFSKDLIENLFDYIFKDIGCVVYKNNLSFDKNSNLVWKKPNCKNSEDSKCKLNDYFNNNKNLFIIIKNEIDKITDQSLITNELRDFSNIIGEALNDPNILRNYKDGCAKLADAIIAVNSNKIDNFFTQNFKESDMLCRIFKQKLYILSNNHEKDVEIKNYSN